MKKLTRIARKLLDEIEVFAKVAPGYAGGTFMYELLAIIWIIEKGEAADVGTMANIHLPDKLNFIGEKIITARQVCDLFEAGELGKETLHDAAKSIVAFDGFAERWRRLQTDEAIFEPE